MVKLIETSVATGAQEGNRTPDLRITSATKSNSVGTLSTSKNRDGLQINQLDVRLDFGEPPTTTLDNCGIATKLLRQMNPLELMLAYQETCVSLVPLVGPMMLFLP